MNSTPGPWIDARAALHLGTGLCAFALGLVPWAGAVGLALLGCLLGFVVFPQVGLEARVRRPGEGYWTGLKTYPLAVLGLVLFLPAPQAAAAWAVLAFGDTAARLVGQRVRSPRVFGHPKLTWAGTLGGVLVGAGAAFGMSAAVHALALGSGAVAAAAPSSAGMCLAAASAAAAADAIPWRPNDNIPVAWAAGLALYPW